MSDKVTIKRIPYGAEFVEDGTESQVYGRRRIMERIGAMLDAAFGKAGNGPVDIYIAPSNDQEDYYG